MKNVEESWVLGGFLSRNGCFFEPLGWFSGGFRANFVLSEENGAGEENASALGKALAFTSVLPWLFCLGCYIFLHWAFPHDRRMLQKEREECLQRHGGRLYTDSGTESDNEDDYVNYLE